MLVVLAYFRFLYNLVECKLLNSCKNRKWKLCYRVLGRGVLGTRVHVLVNHNRFGLPKTNACSSSNLAVHSVESKKVEEFFHQHPDTYFIFTVILYVTRCGSVVSVVSVVFCRLSWQRAPYLRSSSVQQQQCKVRDSAVHYLIHFTLLWKYIGPSLMSPKEQANFVAFFSYISRGKQSMSRVWY